MKYFLKLVVYISNFGLINVVTTVTALVIVK